MVNGIVIEILKMHCMIRRNEFNASHGIIMPVGAIQLVQNSKLAAESESLCFTTSKRRTSLFESNTV
jgi:hypothetical protein